MCVSFKRRHHLFSSAMCASQCKLCRICANEVVKHEIFQPEKGIGGSATTRIIMKEVSLPGQWFAGRCEGRERHFKQFVHRRYRLDEVFELALEDSDGMIEHLGKVGLAVGDQIQLLFNRGTHGRLHQVNINLQHQYSHAWSASTGQHQSTTSIQSRMVGFNRSTSIYKYQ